MQISVALWTRTQPDDATKKKQAWRGFSYERGSRAKNVSAAMKGYTSQESVIIPSQASVT